MSANDYQPGGDHYRRGGRAYQHWDLMADLDAGYFPAVITKYAERHELKAGRLDLEKAVHYAEKWHEVETALRERGVVRWWRSDDGERALVEMYIEENGLDESRASIFRLALVDGAQNTGTLLVACRAYLAEAYPPAPSDVPQASSADAGSAAGRATSEQAS